MKQNKNKIESSDRILQSTPPLLYNTLTRIRLEAGRLGVCIW